MKSKYKLQLIFTNTLEEFTIIINLLDQFNSWSVECENYHVLLQCLEGTEENRAQHCVLWPLRDTGTLRRN